MDNLQWLPRGTEIGNCAVRKMIVSDVDWQIYSISNDGYAIAISQELFKRWSQHNSLTDNLFKPYSEKPDVMLLASDGGFLIASLEKGPYPFNSAQVEAFAVSFNKARKENPKDNFNGAIYLEEYSLILPVNDEVDDYDNGVAFGQWITGGVGVSISDIDAVKRLTSWLPGQTLVKTVEMADVEIDAKTKRDAIAENKQKNSDRKDVSSEPFELAGRRELESFINEHIVDVLKKPDEYKRMGIKFPGATILYGPPGTGKTFAIEKLAEYLDWPRYDINSNTIGSPYIHETGRKISQIFDEAIQNAPSVIVIDEMESFLSAREGKDQHHVEEVAEFLRRIPEAIENRVLVFAMTNIIDSIDPAILRRGRFDYMIEVGYAGEEEILGLLKNKVKDLPVEEKVQLDQIAKRLANHPLSDVTFVLREAGRYAVKTGSKTIGAEAFDNALTLLPKKEDKKTGAIGFVVD